MHHTALPAPLETVVYRATSLLTSGMPKVVTAIPQDCPRCGAPLPPAKEGRTVCKYCHNTIHVEVRQRTHPARTTPNPFAWLKKAQVLWTAILVVGVGGWQVQRFLVHLDPIAVPSVPFPTTLFPPNTHASSGTKVPALPPQELVTEVDSRLLLVNAVNDEHQDCLALARIDGPDNGRWLVAINGRTGRTVWRHRLPADTTPDDVELATSGDSVLVRTNEQLLHLRAKSGEVVWQTQGNTRGARLCATNDYVAVSGNKEPGTAWDWKSGRKLQVKAGTCDPLYSTRGAGSNFDYVEADGLAKLVPASKDLTPLRGLLPRQGIARVILSERAKAAGEKPTMEIGVVTNRRWVWQQELSEHAFAAFPTPPLAAVRSGSVVVPYWDPRNEALRLVAFGLERGKRLWDITLDQSAALPSKTDLGVVLSLDGAVFTRTSKGRLSAYTLSTGTPLWSIGGE